MRNIILLGVLICCILSCNEQTDLFYENKTKILGQWKCVAINQEIEGGEIISNDTSNFNILLKNNEEIIFTYDQYPGYEDIYTWYYQLDPQKVIIVYSEIGIIIHPNNYFNVITNSQDIQRWEEIKYQTDPPSENDKKIIIWSLSRS